MIFLKNFHKDTDFKYQVCVCVGGCVCVCGGVCELTFQANTEFSFIAKEKE